jgi:hypothetical protein
MMVASRIFNFEKEGKDTVAFVPYADMLNYRRAHNRTKWFYSEEQ